MNNEQLSTGNGAKKVPIRQCMGCRSRFPKGELIRVVRSPDSGISIDTKGKSCGRGVYLCRNTNCFKRVRKSRALERSLKSAVPDRIFEEIEGLMADNAT